MTTPDRVTAGLFAVRFRDDMPRPAAANHWETRHADIMRAANHVQEYYQQQFSTTDHGYWPSTPGVGTSVPTDFRLDGVAEVRFRNVLKGLLSALESREILLDEQNLFRHVVGQLTAPRGGRWWPPRQPDDIPHRTAVLLRRRHGVNRKAFRRFVHEDLSAALHRAGALDLRSYVFVPSSKVANTSPGVSHAYPPERRYHGVLVIGSDTRETCLATLDDPVVKAQIARQGLFLSAAHAYTVERSACVIDKIRRLTQQGA